MPLSTVSENDADQLLEHLTAQQYGTSLDLLDLHRYADFLESVFLSVGENTSFHLLDCSIAYLHKEIDAARSARNDQEDQRYEEDVRTAQILVRHMATLNARIHGHRKAPSSRAVVNISQKAAPNKQRPRRRGGAVSDYDYQFMRQMPGQNLSHTLSDLMAKRTKEQRSLKTLRCALRGLSVAPPRTPTKGRGPLLAPPGLIIDKRMRQANRRHFKHWQDGILEKSEVQFHQTPALPKTPNTDPCARTAYDQESMYASEKENIGMPRALHSSQRAECSDRVSTPEAAFLCTSDPQCPHATRKLPALLLKRCTPQRVPLSELPMHEAISNDNNEPGRPSPLSDFHFGPSDQSSLFDQSRNRLTRDFSDGPLRKLEEQLHALKKWRLDASKLPTDDGYDGQSESGGSSEQMSDPPPSKPASRPLPPIPQTLSISRAKLYCHRRNSTISSASETMGLDLGTMGDTESVEDITVVADWSLSDVTVPDVELLGANMHSRQDGDSSGTLPPSFSGHQTQMSQSSNTLAQLVSRLSDQGSLALLRRLHESTVSELFKDFSCYRFFKDHEDSMLHLAIRVYLPNDIHHKNPTSFDALSLHGDDSILDYQNFCEDGTIANVFTGRNVANAAPIRVGRSCLRGGCSGPDLEQRRLSPMSQNEPEMFKMDISQDDMDSTHRLADAPNQSERKGPVVEGLQNDLQSGEPFRSVTHKNHVRQPTQEELAEQLVAFKHNTLVESGMRTSEEHAEHQRDLEEALQAVAPLKDDDAFMQGSPRNISIKASHVQGDNRLLSLVLQLRPPLHHLESTTGAQSTTEAVHQNQSSDSGTLQDGGCAFNRVVFINSKGNEYFCDIDEEYLTDRFNLTSLQTEVQHYTHALDLITDMFDLEVDDDLRESIEKAARHLYGLVHARYIVTTRGLQKMNDKFKNGDFGKCPRVACDGTHLLPMGQNDSANMSPVKLYCAKCEDLYNPKSSRHSTVDGAYFGTTFHNIFFQVYPSLVPAKSAQRYEPRVFGFRMHAAATLSRWQEERRQQMCERVAKEGLDTGYEAEEREAAMGEDGEETGGGEDGIDDMFEVGDPSRRAAQTVWSTTAR